MTMRLVVVDDNQSFRELLRLALDLDPELEVIGEAATGVEGIDRIIDLRPDAVVLDQVLPDISGTQVADAVHRALPELTIVIASSLDADTLREPARRAGVRSVLPKSTPPLEIARELKRVAR